MAKNTYKFVEISPSILGVEFKSHIHMSLMFMRIQEFTEGIKQLRGTILTEGDSLIAYWKKYKKLYYKAGWAGFNVKGSTIRQLAKLTSNVVIWNDYEEALFKECLIRFGAKSDKYKKGQFYVIAYTKGDKPTIKHEKLHALAYLNMIYRVKVWYVIEKNGTKKAKKYLKRLDYNLKDDPDSKYILNDEINAYALEAKSDKMRRNLGLSKSTLKRLRKLYREYK